MAPPGFFPVLYTDILDETAKMLRDRGVEFAPGDGALTFADPDGNWFQLTELAIR